MTEERRIEHERYTLVIKEVKRGRRTEKIVKAVPKNNIRWDTQTARNFLDMFVNQGYVADSITIFGESPTNRNYRLKNRGEHQVKNLDDDDYYQGMNEEMKNKFNSYGNFVFYIPEKPKRRII